MVVQLQPRGAAVGVVQVQVGVVFRRHADGVAEALGRLLEVPAGVELGAARLGARRSDVARVRLTRWHGHSWWCEGEEVSKEVGGPNTDAKPTRGVCDGKSGSGLLLLLSQRRR